MKKTKIFKYTICVVSVLVTLLGVSCKKFLQVQPRDYMFEEEAFSSVNGVESALNGIYQSLADSTLYGNMLTMTATERMAQYYSSNKWIYGEIDYLDYTDPNVKAILNNIWNGSYKLILGTNNFCARLEDSSFKVLSNEQRNIMLGEAYAIRAFLHFDLLRLYGPVFAKDPQKMSIPYIRKVAREAQPVLPAADVIKEVLSDIASALNLLQNDPIRTKGPEWSNIPPIGQSIDFFSNRQRRMNYFAIKALLARVQLYAGMKQEAYQTVQSVLTEQEPLFPWAAEQDYAKDPLLTGESYFGIENRNIYNFYRQQFSPLLTDDIILTPKPARLDEIYSPASTDLRLKYWFKVGTEGNKSYKVFVKFSNATVTDNTRSYYQPLLRKSELYLIAAETAPDLESGFKYLNVLRINKGLSQLNYQPNSTMAEFIINIQNEYVREFIGEGQAFFMFKRLNLPTIPFSFGGGNLFNMDDSRYVIPLPEDETYYR